VRVFLGVCLGLLFLEVSLAQTPPPKSSAAPAGQQAMTQPEPVPTSFTSAKGFVLEDKTPIRLRLNRNVSSADANVGDTVDFEVLDDITLNGMLVIKKGDLAFATVTEAQRKRRMARGGKLNINIDYVRLVSGDKAPLRAIRDVNGGGHTGVMVGGIVATSIVFFPAAPFFLFMHGKDITIPKGTEITAYVNGDMNLDVSKFQSSGPVANPGPNTPSGVSAKNNASSPAKLQVDSEPEGGDIELDGKFVGNTPSEVQVTEGEHTVVVKKSGFKDWEKKLTVSAGSSVSLNAELEKTASQ